ncbi:hypothetical protein FACS1894199_06020 [Bacteroidia bacterium]|nr:hypothetical protein FACS1894199_06020 [Bacteroidia bacterium]
MKVVKSVLCLVLLFSCAEKRGDRAILVTDYSTKLDFSEIVADFKVVALQTIDGFLLGRVTDMCFIGDTIYVLDEMTATIFMFDKATGVMLKGVTRQGQGPNEYVYPISIDCDSEHLWVLDRAGQIICFDKDLNPLETIKLPYMALGFIHTETGFLLCLELVYSHKFASIDMYGHEIKKYIPVTEANNMGKANLGGATELLRSFTKGEKIYLCDGFRSTIYSLNKDSLEVAMEFDFGNLTIPKDVNINNYGANFPYVWKPNFFVTNQYFIIDYFVPNESYRYYTFVDIPTGTTKSGRINYLADTPPFFPQKQDGECLVGIFSVHDIAQCPSVMDKISGISNIDEETMVLLFYTLL